MRPPAIERLVRLPETENAVEPLSVIPEPATPCQSSGDAPVALFTLIATPVTVAVTNDPRVSEPASPLDCTAVQLRPSGVAGVSAAIVTVAAGPPSVIPNDPTPIDERRRRERDHEQVRAGEARRCDIDVRLGDGEARRAGEEAAEGDGRGALEMERESAGQVGAERVRKDPAVEAGPVELRRTGRRVVEDGDAGDGERHRVEADEGAADPVRLDRGVGGAALRDRRDLEAAAERHVDADRAVGDVVAGRRDAVGRERRAEPDEHVRAAEPERPHVRVRQRDRRRTRRGRSRSRSCGRA